jgi:hypothetical protein
MLDISSLPVGLPRVSEADQKKMKKFFGVLIAKNS